jgi:catechol 2,3-dioxygenase-like lactoylglutathione lyase family enzyme
MTHHAPHGPGVAFGRIAAGIPVSDIARALAFYQDILGMSVTFTNGDPVGFAILERDAAELHLTLVKGHKGGSHNVAHLLVADAAALHDHLVSREVRIIKGLRDADYGLRGFVFTDPDGNRVDVGQRLQQAKTDQQMSLRSLWSSRTSARIASGSWSRCHWHSSRPAASPSPFGAAARAALIA